MNKIFFNNNYILFNLNNGTKKAFLGGTLRHTIEENNLAFFLLDNELGELPVINLNYNQTTVNGIQLTEDNIDEILAQFYQYNTSNISDVKLIGDILIISQGDIDYEVDLSKYNYDTVIDALNENLNKEVIRATAEETRIEGKIDGEIQRAEAVEAILNTNIQFVSDNLTDEIADRTAADAVLTNNLNLEIDRAKAKEKELEEIIADLKSDINISNSELEDKIDKEVQDRKDADGELSDRIDAEISSRVSADAELDTKINAEILNRTNADDELNAKIELINTEITFDVTELSEKIHQEINDRKSASNALSGAIQGISDTLTKEVADRTAADAVLRDDLEELEEVISTKQDILISSINIKTINGNSLLGSGDIVISGGSSGGTVSWNDIEDKPSIPTKVSQLTNDSGFITSINWNQVQGKPTFSPVATSGNYNDLLSKPIIPLKVSQLANDSNYATADYVNNVVNDAIEGDFSNYYNKSEVDTKLNNKIDKVTGKQLSSNDFTNTYRTKLDGLYNYDDSNIVSSLYNKVDKIYGKQLSTNDFTTIEKTKLSNTPSFVTLTQTEYDGLGTKDNNTLYIIIG